MPYTPKDTFKALTEEIKSTGQSRKLTVRDLLSYFHQQRRTDRVVRWIRLNLERMGIDCNPDFEQVFIDSTVELRKKPTIKAQKSSDGVAPKLVRDPIPRVALLPAANREPTTVVRDADLNHAITIMMMHDFSQRPVMQNARDVDGIISWKSIVAAQSTGGACQTVKECMVKDVAIMPHDAPLFDAVKTVMSQEVVLVRSQDKKIVGLVTVADIGEQFISLAEPFLILEQVENHIRSLMDDKFTKEQLRGALDPSDKERDVEAISDLAFGEYVRLLQNPEHWGKLGLRLDRGTFTKRLDEIREIRNDVMHFHPDGISNDDLETLRETARFFYSFSQFKRGV
jgi:CBS domain-containing protein